MRIWIGPPLFLALALGCQADGKKIDDNLPRVYRFNSKELKGAKWNATIWMDALHAQAGRPIAFGIRVSGIDKTPPRLRASFSIHSGDKLLRMEEVTIETKHLLYENGYIDCETSTESQDCTARSARPGVYEVLIQDPLNVDVRANKQPLPAGSYAVTARISFQEEFFSGIFPVRILSSRDPSQFNGEK